MRISSVSILMSFVLAFTAPLLAQPSTGAIEGRVVDAATGEPLPGAKIVATGSRSEASTDRGGVFRLAGIASGEQTVAITYLGRRDESVTVNVIAGGVRKLDVQMSAG